MSIYFIGDIHGCFKQLTNLLKKVSFNYNTDKLWVTGDLVSKGPDSIKVLKFLYNHKNSIKIVLGNHDLNLIRSFFEMILYPNKLNVFKKSYYHTKDFKDIIEWLRKQPLVRVSLEKKFIISHAGIPPHWDINLSQFYSKSIEKILSCNNYERIFKILNLSNENQCNWNKNLEYYDKIKFAINSFTRMRYVIKDTNNLDLEYKNYPAEKYKNNLVPWFSIKNKLPDNFNIIFGHWSNLNGKGTPKNFYAMDTGCCWGNKLTLLRWKDKKKFYEYFN